MFILHLRGGGNKEQAVSDNLRSSRLETRDPSLRAMYKITEAEKINFRENLNGVNIDIVKKLETPKDKEMFLIDTEETICAENSVSSFLPLLAVSLYNTQNVRSKMSLNSYMVFRKKDNGYFSFSSNPEKMNKYIVNTNCFILKLSDDFSDSIEECIQKMFYIMKASFTSFRRSITNRGQVIGINPDDEFALSIIFRLVYKERVPFPTLEGERRKSVWEREA